VSIWSTSRAASEGPRDLEAFLAAVPDRL